MLIAYFTNEMFFSSFLLFVLNLATDLLRQLYRRMAYMVVPHVCDYCCCGCHHDDVARGPQISQPICYVALGGSI